MKKVIILLLALVGMTVVVMSSEAQPLNQVLAIVNGQPVTQYQFDAFD